MSVADPFARSRSIRRRANEPTRFGRARISYRSQVEETETIDNLISNVEGLLGRLGTAVDPDLARLRAAVYAGIDHVSEKMRRMRPLQARKRARAALSSGVAIVALSGMVVALWMDRSMGE